MGQLKSNHLAHYAEITTIHGIKDLVFSRSRILRLAWSLCLMVTLSLLCWQIYDTVKYYLSGPTIVRVSNVRLEAYPPIHVCSYMFAWALLYKYEKYMNQIHNAYNFTEVEIRIITQPFLPFDSSWTDDDWGIDTAPNQSDMKSIKDKMEQYNVSSFLNLISTLNWNVSVESQGNIATVQKRLLWTDHAYYCQSISNVSQNEDLEIKFSFISIASKTYTYIVVGEDLYGETVYITKEHCSNLSVEIHGIKKRILLNRPGFDCTEDYNSTQACLSVCQHKREACNCNGTASTTSYDEIERFWHIYKFGECNESPFSSSCNESYNYCAAQCKPCVTLNYHSTVTGECDINFSDAWSSPYTDVYNISLRFTRVPMMEVTEQAYSYAASSMLSYIGGLLGLCCGASVLSLVQTFLFWWGDGCHIGKHKAEDTSEQDNIQSWVKQAALHILHCKLCTTVTQKNIQSQISEKDQKSQQKPNHLANYANNATIHGIQDFLFIKDKFLKLVWGLFLLAVSILMCEEIYRTVINYVRAPTAKTISFVDLDMYPTIHVCSNTWYNDTQARSYGFSEEDLAFIRLAFLAPEQDWDYMQMESKMNSISQLRNNAAFEEQKKSVQHKMEEHNLKTVRDMLNLITWNLSIEGQEFVTSKRWRGRVLETVKSTYVCHSVSNASVQHDLSITLPEDGWQANEFIVVGEDPFAQSIKYGHYSYHAGVYADLMLPPWIPRQMTLKIWDISKRSLLGKHGTCNQGNNSIGVCLQDCASQKDLCSCNGTMKIASYENNEDFFLLASQHDCRDDASCNLNYDRCVELCEPCTTWDYQVSTKSYENNYVPLSITMVPRMKVNQEDYTITRTVPALLSSIGGLMGVFCGASVLSLVQLFLFWWDDGGLLCTTKGTKSNNTDHHIKAWLQQAALRISQCKLCKKLTSTRTQNKHGGEVKTSQQESNHLTSYAENTSIHGIKDLIFSKNKLIKLAWGLMLLVVFCLMCEEIYRTIRDYSDYPTGIDESITLLDKYPPVHVCVEFNNAQDHSDAGLQLYGFDNDEKWCISNTLQGSWCDLNYTQSVSIKEKMKQHNLSTVRDMLNIVTLNSISIADESMLPDDPAPQKRLRREDDGVLKTAYVCYTFSNYTVRDEGLVITKDRQFSRGLLFFVIGEDPFGSRYELYIKTYSWYGIEVWIKDNNQLSLINKGGTCSHDYNSSGICLQDCISRKAACNPNTNSTEMLPSYENNEPFWLLDDRPNYTNTTCQHSDGDCTAKCKLVPCTTWTYERSTLLVPSFGIESNIVTLHIDPRMIVNQEVYTYPSSSLLANVGGLISLFCGGSLLSIVQVILFWWGDGCCSQKGTGRKEESAVIPEDNIHKWIQHAARHRT